jgi:DNA-binding LytR/AlgR family response regulator
VVTSPLSLVPPPAPLLDEPRPIGESTAERIAARSGQALVFLRLDEVLAFEAKDRLCFVHSSRGRFDLDVSLLELEGALPPAFVRVHRNWLVPLRKVRSLETRGGYCCLVVEDLRERERVIVRVPLSRDLSVEVRNRLLAGSIGLRSKRTRG